MADFPTASAIHVGGQTLSYQELGDLAGSIATTLSLATPAPAVRLTAVFAHRTLTAYAGVLAALLRGHGYVPLNRSFPTLRTRAMLVRSGCTELVVDRESAEQLDEVIHSLPPLVLVFPEESDVSEYVERWPDHVVLGRQDLGAPADPASVNPDDPAYVLFTSGSTGEPKGVVVRQRNVAWLVHTAANRYDVNVSDRLSQTFDLTFDLSVFDLFVAWERGACVFCPAPNDLLSPAAFIARNELTMWFSVPSVGVFAKRLNVLKPGSLPTLRWSLFCGEALPAEVAIAWQAAAPHSIVENLYGPTEATIACSAYQWNTQTSPAECHLGVVPIGYPFPGTELVVVDDDLAPVQHDADGELLIAGEQLAAGYLNDATRTEGAFVTIDGTRFYRTGDRVRRPADGKPLLYLGRFDHQIKIRGHRVELGEVEAAVRTATGHDGVVAIGWPVSERGADGIVAFVECEAIDVSAVRQEIATTLPDYMIPSAIETRSTFPVNANGKYDRRALQATLEAK